MSKAKWYQYISFLMIVILLVSDLAFAQVGSNGYSSMMRRNVSAGGKHSDSNWNDAGIETDEESDEETDDESGQDKETGIASSSNSNSNPGEADPAVDEEIIIDDLLIEDTISIDISMFYKLEEIDMETLIIRQDVLACDLEAPEGFIIESVTNPDDPDLTYSYNSRTGRLRWDEPIEENTQLIAELRPMVAVSYIYDGDLVDRQEITYDSDDESISLLDNTMFVVLLDVTDPETGAPIAFDESTYTVEVSDIYRQHPQINVHVDPQNHAITVYYETTDGQVAAYQTYPSSNDNRQIILSKLPSYHQVFAIESEGGEDLLAKYNEADNTLNLGLLQDSIVIYVTIKPVYTEFQIIPYFEAANFTSSESRYIEGTATDIFSMEDYNLLEEAGKVTPPADTRLSDYVYQVDDTIFDGESNPGVAIYSIRYNRKPYLMVFNAAGGYLDTSVPYNYAQQLRLGQNLPDEADVPAPIRAGYDFTGEWEYRKTGSGEVISRPDTMPPYNITAYAKWRPGNVSVKATIVYHYQNIYDNGYSVYASREVEAPVGTFIKLDTAGNVFYNRGNQKTVLIANDRRAEYTYFDYAAGVSQNLTVENTGIEVKGDGSTVVNVYYSRNEYTFRFSMIVYWFLRDQYGAMDIKEEVNGEWITRTYNRANPIYEMKARYGEDISKRWPAGNNIFNIKASNGDQGRFGGWNRSKPFLLPTFGDGDGILHAYMDSALINAYNLGQSRMTTLYAVFVSWVNTGQYTLTMLTENFDYDKPDEFSLFGGEKVVTPGNFGEDKINAMPGMITPTFANGNLVKSTTTNNDYTARYYKRRYQLNFNANGGTFESDIELGRAYDGTRTKLTMQQNGEEVTHSSGKLQFGANLLKYGYGSYARIQPVRPHYTFAGWYDSPLCQKPIDWTAPLLNPSDETDSDVTYYAKWQKNLYNVSFFDTLQPRGDSYLLMQLSSVAYLDPLPEDQEPSTAKEGYNFLGWYMYVDGVKVSYTSGLPITGDMEIFGEWEAFEKVPYHIYYKIEGSDTNIAVKGPFYGAIGEEVTVYADVSVPDMIPKSASKTVKLTGGNNDITFEYVPIPPGKRAKYTIYCYDDNMRPITDNITIMVGGRPVSYIPGTIITLPENVWTVTVNAPQIEGFQPLRMRYSNISLGATEEEDAGDNVFHFQYYYIGTIDYQINYFDLYGNAIMEPVIREGVVNQVIRSDNTIDVAVPVEGYQFAYSTFKREGMPKELRYPTLTISTEDANASELPCMNLYYTGELDYLQHPQDILDEVGSGIRLTAHLRGMKWIDGECVNKIQLYQVVNDVPVLAADQDSGLTVQYIRGSYYTEISWDIPASSADTAGTYYFSIDGYESERAAVSLWAVHYRGGSDALYTSSRETGTAASDTAVFKLYNGYEDQVQMGYVSDLESAVYVQPGGSELVMVDTNYQDIRDNRTKFGYTSGNSRIALSITEDGAGGNNNNPGLEFGLYNYNAITKPAWGEVFITININVPNGSIMTIKVPVAIVMEPAQIDVLMPPAVTAVTDYEGGQAIVSDAYTISNHGGFPIIVSSISTKPENEFVIKKKEELAGTPAKEVAMIIRDTDNALPITLLPGTIQINEIKGSDGVTPANIRANANQTIDLGLEVHTSPLEIAPDETSGRHRYAGVDIAIKIPD